MAVDGDAVEAMRSADIGEELAQSVQHALTQGIVVDPVGQRHVEAEVFEDVGIAPLQHARVLGGRQVRLAPAGDVELGERGPEGVEFLHAGRGEGAHLGTGRVQPESQEAPQRLRRDRGREGRAALRKTLGEVHQLDLAPPLGQFERRLQSRVEAVAARAGGEGVEIDIGQAGHVRARATGLAMRVAAEPGAGQVPELPLRIGRVVDGVAGAHATRAP